MSEFTQWKIHHWQMPQVDIPYEWHWPQFQHDCNNCQFVCNVSSLHGMYDGYICKAQGRVTLLVRFSSDGPDYISTNLSMYLRHRELNSHHEQVLHHAVLNNMVTDTELVHALIDSI